MPRRHRDESERGYPVQDDELCPICKRKIPDDQRDKHHLVPRVKGGRETEFMHRICHRQIHALFSEAELAQKYATIDALLQHPDLQKFVTWIQSKPVDFVDGPKRSHRRR